MLPIFKVNCIFCIDNIYCKNKKVKRSFYGLGKRYCAVDCYTNCQHQVRFLRRQSTPIGQTIVFPK